MRFKKYNNYKVTKSVRSKCTDYVEIIRNNNEFIILDIETTGLSPNKGGKILEIGAVRVKDGEIIGEFSTLINPEMNIPKDSIRIHGITDNMVKSFPIYENVLPSFSLFIKNLPVVIHNAPFDWNRFLLHYFGKLGIYKKNPVIDTIALAKLFLPAENKDSMSLSAVCRRCNIELINAHRAINDAKATSKVFSICKFLIDRDFAKKDQILEQMISMPEENFRESIIDVNYWEKAFSRGGKSINMKRIYITITSGTVFYDLLTNKWKVKKVSKAEVKFDEIKEDVIIFLEKNNNKLLEYFS